ncbi:2-oxo acid dehydrogenase subunit E2 [Sorangium sp. So ce394]|uniref:2-oxo acid dehydrogenase subunit E2 n=1 Tax=Sorangium sp. So ce394 TaxID=3133310 RepID=UPI003F5C7184
MAKITGWRRVASAIWRAPENPQIFGAFDCDAGPLSTFIEAARAAGHHVTPTHLVGRAVAHALFEVPDLNTRIAAGRAVPRRSIDIFFITTVEGDRDLSGVKIASADRKSAVELARELAERARGLKGWAPEGDTVSGTDTAAALLQPFLSSCPEVLFIAGVGGTMLHWSSALRRASVNGSRPRPAGPPFHPSW